MQFHNVLPNVLTIVFYVIVLKFVFHVFKKYFFIYI